jgi:outer membrane murein-binding lipoprotein Lpp
MTLGALVAVVSTALLLAGCGEDDRVSTAGDQKTADGAIAAVEQSLRAEGFSATSDDRGQEDGSAIESEECRKFRDVIPGGDDRIVLVRQPAPRVISSSAAILLGSPMAKAWWSRLARRPSSLRTLTTSRP